MICLGAVLVLWVTGVVALATLQPHLFPVVWGWASRQGASAVQHAPIW